MSPLSDGEQRTLNALLTSIDPFRDLSATFTTQMLYAFIQIAADEGKSISDYADRAGVSKAVMSRHILDLSVKRRTGEAGFGLLVTRASPTDLRRHEVFLTPTGRAMVNKVLRALNLR